MNNSSNKTPVLKCVDGKIDWEFTAIRTGSFLFDLELEKRNGAEPACLSVSLAKDELTNPFGPVRKIVKLSSGLKKYTFYLPLDKGINRGTISLLDVGPESWKPFVPSTVCPGVGRVEKSGDDERMALHKMTISIPDQHAIVAPDFILIPVTNHCNYSCVMCRHGVLEKKPALSHFPEPFAQRFIDALNRSNTSCHVALTGEGEPMMSPVFFKIVNSVVNPLVRFHFATNGSLLNDQNNNWIVKSPFSHVNVSLDAATPGTYRKIRNAPFEPVIRNLEKLSMAIKSSGRSDLRLIINMTLMRENLDEAPAFIELAGRLNAAVVVNYLNDYDYFHDWVIERPEFRFDYEEQMLVHSKALEGKGAKYKTLAMDAGIPFMMDEVMRPLLGRSQDGQLVRPSGVLINDPPISGCPYLWTGDWYGTCVLHSSGELGACCLQQPLGKTCDYLPLEEAIDEVWNGPVGRQTRADILAGKIPAPCGGANCMYVASQRLWDERFGKGKSAVYTGDSERSLID